MKGVTTKFSLRKEDWEGGGEGGKEEKRGRWKYERNIEEECRRKRCWS